MSKVISPSEARIDAMHMGIMAQLDIADESGAVAALEEYTTVPWDILQTSRALTYAKGAMLSCAAVLVLEAGQLVSHAAIMERTGLDRYKTNDGLGALCINRFANKLPQKKGRPVQYGAENALLLAAIQPKGFENLQEAIGVMAVRLDT